MTFDNHLQMHSQNGSVLCIWSRASCLSAVRGFGVISWVVPTVVRSGVIVSLMCCILEGSVSVFTWWWCNVLLFVLNAGPSKFVTVDREGNHPHWLKDMRALKRYTLESALKWCTIEGTSVNPRPCTSLSGNCSLTAAPGPTGGIGLVGFSTLFLWAVYSGFPAPCWSLWNEEPLDC